MTDVKSIADRITQLVVENLGVDQAKVVETANFVDDLEADSLDTVQLIMAMEEEFGIEIPDEDAEKILTVGDAVSYVTKAAANA
jgi:acyl carrier protein